MAVELIGTDDFGRAEYKGLSTDTKPNAEIGSTFYETDTKRVLNQLGGGASGWINNNPGFKLGSNTGELTITTAGVAVARSSGTTHSLLRNYGATNFFRFGFGESEADAITNAANGRRVLVNEIVEPKDCQWPANATHMGLVADTANVTGYQGQGVMN